MSTSYKEVEEFHRVREPGTKSRLRELDEALSKERDTNKDKVPLYGNNWRVKTVNSIYLKLRRKNMVLDKLTDFGGMRLLCMFEQDLVPVHRALLSVLNPRFELKEIEVHNLDNANLVQELEISTNEIAKKARGYEFHRSQDQDSENSAVSGYKSIHYSVCWKEEDNTRSFIEIQLRTLVQEVWAELSHTLSYKQGRVHPHVTKGFDLLARDLSKADKLLTHLRHTSDREQTIGAYSLSKLGPYKVFWYDAARLPSVFQKNPLKAFSDYAKHVRKGADGKISSAHQKAWIAKRWELYSGELAEMDLRKSENGKEWKTIEEAYFMFCGIDVDDSLIKHKMVQGDSNESWLREKVLEKYRSVAESPSGEPNIYRCVANFRMGEIYFTLGELENSLQHFDRSERLLPTASDAGKYLCRSRYHVSVRLSGIYWRMGSEYSNLALEKIETAEKILTKHGGYFTPEERHRLLNNACWHRTEHFLLVDQKKNREKTAAFQSAKKSFKAMEEELVQPYVSSNSFDTAAWFAFCAFRRTKEEHWLEKALQYCGEMWARRNAARDSITSGELQRIHTQEILMATKQKKAIRPS